MNCLILGAGYVGLVSGACFSDLGHHVTCIEIDPKKHDILKRGDVPFFEPGLNKIVQRNSSAGRLKFDAHYEPHIESAQIILACLGTPALSDGRCDLSYIFEAAKKIFETIKIKQLKQKIWVTKSTVPVGTAQKLIKLRETFGLTKDDIAIVSNPEFLREGSAIHDFFHPDRVVIGTLSEHAKEVLDALYRPLYLRDVPIVYCSLQSAELAKYASNAFLATKISFINEIANLCEACNADVKDISKIMGMDQRIGKFFLHPGPGYGGSCFPKDVKALNTIFKEHKLDSALVTATNQANNKQKNKAFNLLQNLFKDTLSEKTIAIAGLSFKSNTDDLRESSSLVLIDQLLKEKSQIRVFDPEAMENMKALYSSQNKQITYCKNSYDAAKGSHAFIIMTEWHAFRSLDLNKLKKALASPYFLDFRKIYEAKEIDKTGLSYYILGRKNTLFKNL